MTYAKYRKVPANLLIHASKPSRTQASVWDSIDKSLKWYGSMIIYMKT